MKVWYIELSVGNIPNREILSFKSEITLNLRVLCITNCNQILSFHKYNYYFVGISWLCMHLYGFTFELLFDLLQTSQPHPHRGVRKTAQLPKDVEAIEDDKQGLLDDVSCATSCSRL